jgi:hypothetical protein
VFKLLGQHLHHVDIRQDRPREAQRLLRDAVQPAQRNDHNRGDSTISSVVIVA